MRANHVFALALCFPILQSASAWSWGGRNNKKNNNDNILSEAKKDDDGVILEEEISGLRPMFTNSDGMPMAHLHNDYALPLVGLSVQQLPSYMVPLMTASALQEDKRTRLLDLAHAPGHEVMVVSGIKQGLDRLKTTTDSNQKMEVHVLTKVWYTHLGYHRTFVTVKETYAALQEALGDEYAPRVDLKVHVLLQWPRCYENIDWMNCEMEEETVTPHIQEVGPPPHQDKENAWKESWKALEDLYLSQELPIKSIGVANFHLKDLREMDKFGVRVHPHVLQISVWSLLYDPMLVNYCQRRDIHLQIVDSIDGILADPSRAPNASHHLLKIAEDLMDASTKSLEHEVTPSMVISAWLIQHGISIVPGTDRLSELQDNSAVSLGALPLLNRTQGETVAQCVEAFLSGDDLEKDIHTIVTFHAKSKDAMLYWQNPAGGESKIAFIARGSSFNETTYPKHHFRIYDARNKDNWVDYTVQARFGEHITYEAYLD